jgi:Lon protease-like protein
MTDLLPLFPLPHVVLFPNVFLPLHVFEPRYLEMVADALAGDRMIGMILLRPNWEHAYEGRPPVHEVGCSGLITHFEKLADGRYNIILRGIERFRVREEDHARSYRQAVIDSLPDSTDNCDRDALRHRRIRLEALLVAAVDSIGTETFSAAAMGDADLVNALAQYLDFEPLEKQALLERPGPLARADSLIELLEMKMLMARTPGRFSGTH